MPRIDRSDQPGPKRLLAIDGGGIRGVLSLGILARIEAVLKAQSGRDDKFRLSHYFDYIAGTSTGWIIAAGLAIGKSVKEILEFYQEAGAQIFVKTNLLRRLRYKYESEPLAEKLKEVFGPTATFGAGEVQTLLMLVMRNATTDSPWPLSNNPYAKYNDRGQRRTGLRPWSKPRSPGIITGHATAPSGMATPAPPQRQRPTIRARELARLFFNLADKQQLVEYRFRDGEDQEQWVQPVSLTTFSSRS